jgi:hypothetical protein
LSPPFDPTPWIVEAVLSEVSLYPTRSIIIRTFADLQQKSEFFDISSRLYTPIVLCISALQSGTKKQTQLVKVRLAKKKNFFVFSCCSPSQASLNPLYTSKPVGIDSCGVLVKKVVQVTERRCAAMSAITHCQ